MALSKQITFTGNAVLQAEEAIISLGEKEATVNFYIRVERISGNKNTIDFRATFKSDISSMSKDYSFAYDINGSNPISQAYEYLKSLPEFADSVDC